MIAAKSQGSDKFNGWSSRIIKKNKVERIEGSAKFIDLYTIEVCEGGQTRRVQADHFIIATGSNPSNLPFLKFDEKVIISSTGALSLEKVPKRMIVIGAGVIGVELASVYRRLGTDVKIIEMLDEICITMDPTIRKTLLRLLKQQGIEFYLSATVKAAKTEPEGIKIDFEMGGEAKSLQGDIVLVAVGRKSFYRGFRPRVFGDGKI